MDLPPASVEQQVCVSHLLSGNNVVVQAEAGSGKSSTFYHAAKAWIDTYPETKIIQLCYNVNLRVNSEKRIARLNLQDSIDCFTIHALASIMYATRISDNLALIKHLQDDSLEYTSPDTNYTLCLIDEAQDLTKLMIDVVNNLQKIQKMRYMVVGDMRQEIYDFSREEKISVLANPEMWLLSNGLPWVMCSLRTSYRMTAYTCEFLNLFLRHPTQPMIVPGNTLSLNRKPIYVVGNKDNQDLFRIVSEMLTIYSPDQIMILSPSVVTPRSGCQELAARLSDLNIPIFSTHKQRAEINEDMLKGKLFLSSYHQSKGDERDCVIVLGVDMNSWIRLTDNTLNESPVIDNKIHVACTRAREQLIIFQDSNRYPYPSILCPDSTTYEDLKSYVDLRIMSEPAPLPLKEFPKKLIERDDQWLVKFPTQETVELIVRNFKIDEPIHMGPSVRHVPLTCARMPCGAMEDVGDYFPNAIISAVEKMRGADIEKRPIKTALELKLRVDIDPNLLPQIYKQYYVQSFKAGRSPDGPRAWLMLSAMHNALLLHNYRHELKQLSHFDWVGENEIEYFQRCVQNLLTIVRKHTYGHFHEIRHRKNDTHKVRIKATLPYAEWVEYETGSYCIPWQFSFDDSPTEETLLYAIVHMWLCYSKRANIYCVSTNQLYKISVESDEVVSDFIDRLMGNKRKND